MSYAFTRQGQSFDPQDSLKPIQDGYSSDNENIAQNLLRNTARTTTNLMTLPLRLTGDTLGLVNDFVAAPISKALTGKSTAYEDTPLGKVFGRGESIKKGLESATKGYLKPQSKYESWADELIDDTAMFLFPELALGRAGTTARGVKGGIEVAKARNPMQATANSFIKSLGGNAIKAGVKDWTGSDTAGDVGKMGSYVLMSLLDKNNALRYATSLMSNAKNSIPKGARVVTQNLEKEIQKMRNGLYGHSSDVKFIRGELDEIEKHIQNGTADIREIIGAKESVNKTIEGFSSNWLQNDRASRKGAKKLLKPINKMLNDTIDEYGKIDPKFHQLYRPANDAVAAYHQSNAIENFIRRLIPEHPVSYGLEKFLGISSAPLTSLKTKAGGAGLAGYQAGKIGYRMAKSPFLRDFYLNILKSAAEENVPATVKYINKFNHANQKLDEAQKKENPWEISKS